MEMLVTWVIEDFTFRAGLATTEAEREECYRFRYQHYHNRLKQIPPHPWELDIDFADQHSSLLCATFEDERIVGTSRHIHCEHGCLLTHGREGRPEVFSGQTFELPTTHPITGEALAPHELVEGSRWVGTPYELPSGTKVLVSRLLMEATMRLCRLEGDTHIVTAMVHDKAAQLQQDGWDFVELYPREDGEPHRYHDALVRVGIMKVPPAERDYTYRRTL